MIDTVGASTPVYLAVALDVPLPGLFDYSHCEAVAPGVRVRVRFAHRDLVGMVCEVRARPAIDPARVHAIEAVLDDLPPMPADWMRLTRFAAAYYHRAPGEVLLPALPASLRTPAAYTGPRAAGGPVARADRRPRSRSAHKDGMSGQEGAPSVARSGDLALTDAQAQALDMLQAMLATHPGRAGAQAAPARPDGCGPVRPGADRDGRVALLHGITGSGKTELYLRLAAQCLARGQQVLILVPEINLTPQLEQWVRARLAPDQTLAVLHSRLSEGDRLRAWLRALRGQADIVLGTRLALFTPLPRLGLIVVDEEHDASYKQQEGLRYSARDLAVWRSHDLDIPVVLGSATPSLESWLHARQGRYRLLSLPKRARSGGLPAIELLDTRRAPLQQGFSEPALQALEDTLQAGLQSLVFINRRGYAPVLRCPSCAWISGCRRCSAHMVLHRRPAGRGAVLQCHHCGASGPVPRACPECGDQDLHPLGSGTQRVEHFLTERFPGARILRIDADATRRKGSAEALFAQVHAGAADILVGTQMVSKGHDFARLALVTVLNADAMLFAQDFRAPERLFAQLMQVAGRAGRHGLGGRVLVQTDYPEQSVYQSLVRHDYAGFAADTLQERRDLALPPWSHQALLTARARRLQDALDFLLVLRADALGLPEAAGVRVLDAVPLRIMRVDRVERAQMLLEADHRPLLHRLLQALLPRAEALSRARSAVRWGVEVDPLEI
ncbi:primosomal protein N' [Castellaniella sp.]|uniref:primosomal protein N' n=1 Tax=Castellaniella sp. TaxID=1955812 RepID=UPI0035628155